MNRIVIAVILVIISFIAVDSNSCEKPGLIVNNFQCVHWNDCVRNYGYKWIPIQSGRACQKPGVVHNNLQCVSWKDNIGGCGHYGYKWVHIR